MRIPSARTKLVVLLGNPLGHSRSPAMHNSVFDKLGLDYLYLPVEVDAQNLHSVFSGLKRMNVAGFNVTIPHKQRIMPLLDDIDPLARSIGAVNTISVEQGRTRGYNTDGEGFLMSLQQELGPGAIPDRVFILGCGGAARAIGMTLAARGTSRIYLCNRTLARAADLAVDINALAANCAEVIEPEPARMRPALDDSRVLINATSLGMAPEPDNLPLEPSVLHRELVVADIVYNPLMTRLLELARSIGCRIVTGRGMLIYQGALAFELWTGVAPPPDELAAGFDSAADAHGSAVTENPDSTK